MFFCIGYSTRWALCKITVCYTILFISKARKGSLATGAKESNNFIVFLRFPCNHSYHFTTSRAENIRCPICNGRQIEIVTKWLKSQRRPLCIGENLHPSLETANRVWRMWLNKPHEADIFETGRPCRSIVKSPRRASLLGEYILSAAKMYTAMDIESDVRALRENIFGSPPLHARRTLD